SAARPQRGLPAAHQRGRDRRSRAPAGARRHRAAAARRGRALGPAQGLRLPRLSGDGLQDPGRHGRRQLRPLPGPGRRDGRVDQDHRPGAGGAAGRAVHRRGPQVRAAAALGALDLDGVADPPLQAGHRGLPGRPGRDLLRDRGPARGARLLRPRRRLLEAGPRPLPRSELRQPAELPRHGDGLLRRRHDLLARHARPDPRRGRSMSPVDGAGASNPNLPVDRAVTEGRVPSTDPQQIPELAEVDCPAELQERIETLMARYPDRRSASIPALWAVQERYGWCTPDGIRLAAAVMRVTPAYLESVASFYDLLHTTRVGEHRIEVCTNISCWMRGGDELLDAFRAAAAGEDVFVTGFECLGACDIAPMASIDQRYFGPLLPGEAQTAIDQLLAGEAVLPEKSLEKRPLAGDTEVSS